MIEAKYLRYEYPMFVDQIIPNGLLTRDVECHACWNFAMLAQKQLELAGDIETQIIEYDTHSSDMPLWRNPNTEKIARSVAIIYGLESPADFLKYYNVVMQEGRRLGIEFAIQIFFPTRDN